MIAIYMYMYFNPTISMSEIESSTEDHIDFSHGTAVGSKNKLALAPNAVTTKKSQPMASSSESFKIYFTDA